MTTMNEEQRQEFKELTDPLIKYLNDNHHPHMKIIIDPSSAEIVEGVNCHRTEEHWRD